MITYTIPVIFPFPIFRFASLDSHLPETTKSNEIRFSIIHPRDQTN